MEIVKVKSDERDGIVGVHGGVCGAGAGCVGGVGCHVVHGGGVCSGDCGGACGGSVCDGSVCGGDVVVMVFVEASFWHNSCEWCHAEW